jgi:transposase InsO family protein
MPFATQIVEHVVRTCDNCQFTQRDQPVPQPLHPLPRVDACDLWAFDFIGPLPKTKKGNQYILTTMDHGTDFTFAIPLPHRSADAVKSLFYTIISTFGLPKSVLTDNGEEFMSYTFQNVLQRLRVQHLHTSPYHPQTNGRLEKFNDTVVQMLARLCAPDRQDQWDEYLPDALLAHRAHTSSSTGTSPAYMMFGRNPRLPNQSVFDSIRIPPTDAEIEKLQHARLEHIKNLESYRQEANAKALARLEAEADKRDGEMVERGLGIGDLVLRKSERQSKLHPRWDGPFLIYDVSEKNTYQLMTRNGYILRHLYNGNRLRPYFQRADRRYAEAPDSALWYASGDLQRRDAQHRLRTSRLPAKR